ncbi:pep a2 [Streptomyces acidicola]|uniref:pep a2 n=1 Tax=Streptomyces acidicola TaxID=2596892 RepID=UPI001D138753|nr:pep a2 [Streptomyces acidicola]
MKTAVPCYYHLDVEVSPERVGQVRRIMAAHLRYWDLETLVEPVCQGAELLLRAIDEHATDKNTSIEMWWNRQYVITAFGQNDRELWPDQDLRACLVGIAALSDGWGCCATAAGSKVIWFSQRARAGERAPLVPTAPTPTEREALRVPREMPVPVLVGPEGEVPVPALTGHEGAVPDEWDEAR